MERDLDLKYSPSCVRMFQCMGYSFSGPQFPHMKCHCQSMRCFPALKYGVLFSSESSGQKPTQIQKRSWDEINFVCVESNNVETEGEQQKGQGYTVVKLSRTSAQDWTSVRDHREVSQMSSLSLSPREEERLPEDLVSWSVLSEKGSCTSESPQCLHSHFQSQELQRRLGEASTGSPITQAGRLVFKEGMGVPSCFKK